jgi:hypothetical protein
MAARYVTPDADVNEYQWKSLQDLIDGPWYHNGDSYQPSQNDYAIFINNADNNSVWRAIFNDGGWYPTFN